MQVGESLLFNKVVECSVADFLPLGASYAPWSAVARGLTLRGTTKEYKVPIMLSWAVSSLLHTNRGPRVSTRYLKPLEDLSRVWTYDLA